PRPTASSASGSDVVVRPDTSADAFVERVGREVGGANACASTTAGGAEHVAFGSSREGPGVAICVANRLPVVSLTVKSPAIIMAFKTPRVGLEPTTLRLTAGCSAN